jgi:hypothetical protein
MGHCIKPNKHWDTHRQEGPGSVQVYYCSRRSPLPSLFPQKLILIKILRKCRHFKKRNIFSAQPSKLFWKEVKAPEHDFVTG